MRPQIKVNAALGGSAVTTLQLTTDCRGYTYASLIAYTSTTGGLHTTATNTILEESDDNSTYTTVSTGVTLSTVTSLTTVAKVIWNIDLRGRKRYIRPTIGFAATTNPVLTCVLYNASKDAPVTAALANANNIANI